MGRGRKPAPITTLKLRGTYQPHRHAGAEPPAVHPKESFDPPAWLNREAKAEWKRLVPHLIAFVGVAKIDRGTLAAYCAAWGEFQRASKRVEKEGDLITCKNGNLVAHPSIKIRNDSRNAMLKFGTSLGLSPSARTGLHRAVSPPPASNSSPRTDNESKFFAG